MKKLFRWNWKWTCSDSDCKNEMCNYSPKLQSNILYINIEYPTRSSLMQNVKICEFFIEVSAKLNSCKLISFHFQFWDFEIFFVRTLIFVVDHTFCESGLATFEYLSSRSKGFIPFIYQIHLWRFYGDSYSISHTIFINPRTTEASIHSVHCKIVHNINAPLKFSIRILLIYCSKWKFLIFFKFIFRKLWKRRYL